MIHSFGSSLGERTANHLIDAGCVLVDTENQFKLVSGKLSPVYCNIRNLYTIPKIYAQVVEYLLTSVPYKHSYFDYPINNDVVLIGGESAGIPLATTISQETSLPFLYVRKKPKGYGVGKNLVGNLSFAHQFSTKAILVEDMITDGGSKVDFIDRIEEEGFDVVAVLSIFAYGQNRLKQEFLDKQVPLYHLTNWEYVLRNMLSDGTIDSEQYHQIYESLYNE